MASFDQETIQLSQKVLENNEQNTWINLKCSTIEKQVCSAIYAVVLTCYMTGHDHSTKLSTPKDKDTNTDIQQLLDWTQQLDPDAIDSDAII